MRPRFLTATLVLCVFLGACSERTLTEPNQREKPAQDASSQPGVISPSSPPADGGPVIGGGN
jgi:hypothetical protein